MSMDQAYKSKVFTNAEVIYNRAVTLTELARECGVVLTIHTQPRQPLAMGNHDMVVEVRKDNKTYRGDA